MPWHVHIRTIVQDELQLSPSLAHFDDLETAKRVAAVIWKLRGGRVG